MEITVKVVKDEQIPGDLKFFIYDDSLLAEIILIAETRCTQPIDVKRFIYNRLRDLGYDVVTLRSGRFLRALIPHLVLMKHADINNLQHCFRTAKS